MLGFGRDLECHDGEGSVDEADSEADQEPADEGHPHGNRGEKERSDGDCTNGHQRTADDREPAAQVRIMHARLADRTDGPCERAEGDPPGGGRLGPPVHALEDERDHDGETDL